jgi:hypothetical protein
MSVDDSFKINLNQNLWGLVAAFTALGTAEHWGLRYLFWVSLVTSIVMTLSVLVTTFFYTVSYCQNKPLRKNR